MASTLCSSLPVSGDNSDHFGTTPPGEHRRRTVGEYNSLAELDLADVDTLVVPGALDICETLDDHGELAA